MEIFQSHHPKMSAIPYIAARSNIICAFINAFGSRATNITHGACEMAMSNARTIGQKEMHYNIS